MVGHEAAATTVPGTSAMPPAAMAKAPRGRPPTTVALGTSAKPPAAKKMGPGTSDGNGFMDDDEKGLMEDFKTLDHGVEGDEHFSGEEGQEYEEYEDDEDDEWQLTEAFKVVYGNGDGFISAAEFKHDLEQSGEEYTYEECIGMIREADRDSDGQINYEEFGDWR